MLNFSDLLGTIFQPPAVGLLCNATDRFLAIIFGVRNSTELNIVPTTKAFAHPGAHLHPGLKRLVQDQAPALGLEHQPSWG